MKSIISVVVGLYLVRILKSNQNEVIQLIITTLAWTFQIKIIRM